MKIKGLILNSRREFVSEHFGTGAWEKVVKSLPEEDRKNLGDSFLTAEWYDFALGERLDKAIVDVLAGSETTVFEEIGAKSAQKNLTTIHKLFLCPGDPQSFMKKAPSIYKFYYDTGYREYEETGTNSGVMTTFDAETFSIPDCLTVIGWYKQALQMCGVKSVEVVEEECRAKGGGCCRYRFHWQM